MTNTAAATIYPTHTCFDDALDNMKQLMMKDPDLLVNGELIIVHGIIAPEGSDIAHAWVELNGSTVVDSGILNGEKITMHVNLLEFYEKVLVKDVTKYKPLEAAAAEVTAGHYGPWVKRYRELLND